MEIDRMQQLRVNRAKNTLAQMRSGDITIEQGISSLESQMHYWETDGAITTARADKQK